MKVGIKGLTFDSSHYTLSENGKCESLHGHTFELELEVEGEINAETGMIMDFSTLKKAAREVLSEYDHKLILPASHISKTQLSGLFRTDIKLIDYPHATTEYIALSILKDLRKKIDGKITVRLYEGKNNFVEVKSDEL
ncbi:MAG: 6-carboxytetrahydropterin synthase [Fervidicoccaceae archaeon]